MCKVLLVEDEEIEMMALKKILIENVSNIDIVGEANTRFKAIDLIDEKEIDLVFMDINIPGLDGLQVIKYIKNNYPNIIVIIITAYDEFEIAHTAIKLKVDDYLLKPVKPSLIIDTLEQHFNKVEENNNIVECNKYIKKLRNEIVQKSYTNSVNLMREYIFKLYESTEDINIISGMMLEFGKGIIKISQEMNFNSTVSASKQLDKMKAKRIPYYDKYSMYMEMVKIINIIFDEIINSSLTSEKDMKNVVNYIERNIKNGITLEDVSNYANMSVYYLSKIFKKEMNINFITYITDKKIEIAKDMLENTDDPIINIAIELSYNEANYFSKAFKKKVGMTPSEYRERHHSKKISLKCANVN
nr:response regulator [Sedimentibacter sp.]